MIKCTFENSNEASLRHVTVGVILLNDAEDQILLVKRALGYLEGGKYCLPGGFLDRDETTQQAAIRESLEETGYRISIIKLFRIKDNPDRSGEDRQNVDFIYIGKAIRKVSNFDKEITNIDWFKFDKLPSPDEVAFDHYDDIKLYLKL